MGNNPHFCVHLCDDQIDCRDGYVCRDGRCRESRICGDGGCSPSEQCADCPYAAGCPASRRRDGTRRLRKRPSAIATEVRQHQQRQPSFKTRYKIRSGVESTNREGKQRHGLAKPRVRGKARLELAVHLKLLALNTKRVCGYYLRLAAETELVPRMAMAG